MGSRYIPKGGPLDKSDLFPDWGNPACVHDWEQLLIEVGPASAEVWGPELANILDTPVVGAMVEQHLGDLVLSEAEAEEHRESAMVRFCHQCGLIEDEL